MENPFYEIMAGRTNEKLLGVLRERRDYLPAAIEAARQELLKRNVSGFEMEAALEEGESAVVNSDAKMRPKEVFLWLLLSFLALSPLIPWQYKRYWNLGYRRKSSQFLEVTLIGMTLYMTLALIFFTAKNSGMLN